MSSAPLPPNEGERLDALKRYHVLDSPPEVQFDDLTLLASQICGTPIALVSLIDEKRQWFKSRVGLEVPETARDLAFCAHAILEAKPLIVTDATDDDRFRDNPLVTGGPEIRFYAGAQLVTPDGHAVGTLCAIDRKVRDITPEQIQALQALARQVVALLELRRHYIELGNAHVELGERQQRIIDLNSELRQLLDKTFGGSVRILSDILSMVECQFFSNGQRAREYAQTIVRAMNLTESAWEIEIATMLAPIGYVTLPAAVVEKIRNGLPLRPTEQGMVDRAPEIASNLLSKIPRLEGVSQVLLYQKKQFNGQGFPTNSVNGDEIPIGARLIKIVFDLVELETRGIPKEKALDTLDQRKGVYDPKLLRAARKALLESDPIRNKRSLRLAQLAPGQTVALDVQTNDGTLLLPAGQLLNEVIIEKLRNFAALSGIREPIIVN